jgi:hypothetical protein
MILIDAGLSREQTRTWWLCRTQEQEEEVVVEVEEERVLERYESVKL